MDRLVNIVACMTDAIAIRADASLLIGTGHIMRCLTLARALRGMGYKPIFISRLLEGNLCDYIETQGFPVTRLPRPCAADSTHDWLGLPWETDARQTEAVLNELARPIAWLIVDHYCLDARWEQVLRRKVGQVLVIDDLADRPHDCDLLLDQNLGRSAEDYSSLVPISCRVMAGPHYAILRQEFAQWRDRSLARSRWPVRRILISMGGVDKDNATSAVLDVLENSPRAASADIEVIMGQHSPWLEQVKDRVAHMRRAAVHVNVGNMAERMANSDLAIGAAGASSWERCCLGLPTLTVILADNQRPGAFAMDDSGVQLTIGAQDQIASKLAEKLNGLDQSAMNSMSQNSRALVDGLGVQRVIEAMHA